MGEEGHRYSFGPPKGGWPSFPKRTTPPQHCRVCGLRLNPAEEHDNPALQVCFECGF